MDSKLPPQRRRSTKQRQYLTAAAGQKLKFATRHLAALDFLLGIKMTNEQQIRENGITATRRLKEMEAGLSNLGDSSPTPKQYTCPFDDIAAVGAQHDAPGRKLQGHPAPTVRLPLQFRYKLMRISDQSAVIRYRTKPLHITITILI